MKSFGKIIQLTPRQRKPKEAAQRRYYDWEIAYYQTGYWRWRCQSDIVGSMGKKPLCWILQVLHALIGLIGQCMLSLTFSYLWEAKLFCHRSQPRICNFACRNLDEMLWCNLAGAWWEASPLPVFVLATKETVRHPRMMHLNSNPL